MTRLIFFSNLVDSDESDRDIQRDPELYQYPESEDILLKPEQTLLIVIDEIKYPTVIWRNHTWIVTNLTKYLCYIITNKSSDSYIIEQGCCLREIIEKTFIHYVVGCVSDTSILQSALVNFVN